MNVLLAVLIDLWEFVTGIILPKSNTTNEFVATPLLLKQRQDFTALNKPEPASPVPIQNLKPVVEISDNVMSALPLGYVVVAKARVMAKPLWAFDCAIGEFGYAEQINILGYEGRFVHILFNTESAWILKDEITTSKDDVHPSFLAEHIYLASDSETKKLRQYIRDDFFSADLYLPLQSVEFVAYKFLQKMISIPWGPSRPRSAGMWQELLKGRLGVKIGILPKTGSILEYRSTEGSGFLGYVSEVHLDESIKLLSVGRKIEGKYAEENLSKEEWQALGSVFIQIT